MTAILGISAFYHDSAAALVVDGQVVAAAQEERFTRRKHDDRLPIRAIEYCLAEAGLTAEAIDYAGFYDKPLLKFERLLETYLSYAPVGLRSFATSIPVWLRDNLHTRRHLHRALGKSYQRQLVFAEHHESHAASAFFASPFEEAAILTADGVGEWATTSYGTGRGNRIALTNELRFPHSLGLLYSAFTYFCGFRVNSGEYKLMGLAPYGEPRFVDVILEKLIDVKPDGSFRLDMSYFNYCQGLTMTSRRWERLFGGPPRGPESPLTDREKDLAASIQAVTEIILLRIARHVHAETGMRTLCMAGGVALNAVANGRLLRESPFEEVWVQPAAGDAGGALGVALLIWHQLLNKPREPLAAGLQGASSWGPGFDNAHVTTFLNSIGATYHTFASEDELCRRVAQQIADQNVVGWFQGRMEFGPRALGARSILGDPRGAEMQSRMNQKIKFRESFRPFAPAVLRDQAAEVFELGADLESPYMTLVAPVRDGRQLPAITHVDGSARLQTVDAERRPRFHKLLEHFQQQTGCPAVINTSFNVRGEPLVCTPQDAYDCFMATDLDVLVMEDCMLLKTEQPEMTERAARAYRDRFVPD